MKNGIISRAEQSRAEQSRAAYIDFLRIIACLMVIFNHTNERGFYRYISDEPGTCMSVLNLIFSIACKSAVPVFFMISGAMLLNKKESLLKTYKRSIKILLDIIIFSIIYFSIDYIISGTPISILKSMIQGNYWHLWYLYSYVALIVTLPFLRKFAASIESYDYRLIYILACCLMIVYPIFEYFCSSVNGCLRPTWLTTNIFIYPLLGYAIEYKIESGKLNKKDFLRMWMLNAAVFMVSEIAEYFYLIREPGNASETFLTITCIVNAPVIYLTIKMIFAKIHITHIKQRVITEIGKCTFGAYLLHILVLWKTPLFYNMWVAIEQFGFVGRHVGVFLSVLLTFVVSVAVTFCLRRVPLINKIL